MAPDGSLAVLDKADEGLSLATYGPDGTPRRTFVLPREAWVLDLAHGGEWLAGSSGETVILVHAASGALRRFRVAQEDSSKLLYLGFADGGAELRVVDLERRRLLRFATPTL